MCEVEFWSNFDKLNFFVLCDSYHHTAHSILNLRFTNPYQNNSPPNKHFDKYVVDESTQYESESCAVFTSPCSFSEKEFQSSRLGIWLKSPMHSWTSLWHSGQEKLVGTKILAELLLVLDLRSCLSVSASLVLFDLEVTSRSAMERRKISRS